MANFVYVNIITSLKLELRNLICGGVAKTMKRNGFGSTSWLPRRADETARDFRFEQFFLEAGSVRAGAFCKNVTSVSSLHKSTLSAELRVARPSCRSCASAGLSWKKNLWVFCTCVLRKCCSRCLRTLASRC